ncbi:MAG: hypothetical protein U9Q74_08265 [Gemmatimonadota bacterium]|nr:hypothetical protein [Gemmatimonadota bacterium]
MEGELPLELPHAAEGVPDIAVRVRAAPEWARSPADPARTLVSAIDEDANLLEVAWTADGNGIRLRYAEGATFWVSQRLNEIWLDWRAPLTVADAAHFLLEPVLAFVLRQRGDLVLHASGVAFGGRAAIICGPAGAGKSTTAGACLLAGAAMLSDDVLRVTPSDDTWHAHPGTSNCRVWDDGARALVGDASRAPVFSATWDKRVVRPAAIGAGVAAEPVPVALVCILGSRAGGSAPRFDFLSGYEAARGLLENASPPWVADPAVRATELRAIAALAGAVPVARLLGPDDPGVLRRVASLIREAVGG